MKEELSTAGLEVILHDHHHFSSDHVIGGLRMCVPIKKKEDNGESDAFFSKRGVSPIRARSSSPIQNSSENCMYSYIILQWYTVEPPIKDTPNKGHNRNNLRDMDKLMETFLYF